MQSDQEIGSELQNLKEGWSEEGDRNGNGRKLGREGDRIGRDVR